MPVYKNIFQDWIGLLSCKNGILTRSLQAVVVTIRFILLDGTEYTSPEPPIYDLDNRDSEEIGLTDIKDYEARIVDVEKGADGKTLLLTVTAPIEEGFNPEDLKGKHIRFD